MNLPQSFPVTVVGYGAMGRPMARRLAERGCDVVAVDPSSRARVQAADDGVRAVDDIASALRSAAVLVLVATGSQLLETAKSAAVHRRVDGETWVVCSTVGRQATAEAAELLAGAGADVVDAPVTGGVSGAERGELRFLAAGEPTSIAALNGLFSALGVVTAIGERPGDGQATKLVNQLCSSVHLAAAAEAIAFAVQLGLDPVRTVDAIRGGSGASWFLDERGPRMAELDTVSDVLTRLAILTKDNGLSEAEADACGADVPLLKAAKQQYARAAELGLLEADDSQLIRAYLD
ncbi:3-hydroxyisobutyrate dehydrogenase [Saccharopolyspora lacisalsi]|uniref:3-hydroxyisobutyrate dehydrogenase n=1 Tax=Halosaccharopolyspora lacisalsi TaxID=1000566 RepID=A0A839DV09_9PSEU|nr:NAD(P)-dependent oxidoreductase [Halosaccharopolyspora lacisalsi]MBA8824096.1 3-hydroxyisobutyrate dehydrogenase [Halosaccharopolyspora lacisalsi]